MEGNNMELVEREKFGDLECSIYRDSGAGELFFTREQIGTALEYSDPRNSILQIHKRHADRLDKFSVVVPISKSGGCQTVTPHSDDDISDSEGTLVQTEPTYSDDSFHPEYGGTQETVLYSRKGVMEICRWSRQPKADAFMDWVWEVTDRLMRGEVILAPGKGEAAVPTGDVCAQLDAISGALTALDARLTQSVQSMDERFSKSMVELDKKVSKVQTASSFSNYYLRCQMRSGYDERWERSQRPRLKAIAEFIGIDEKRLLREIYIEMEVRYGVDLDSFVSDYKRTKNVTSCSTLSVISFSLTLREMFNAVVDEVLAACGIDMPDAPRAVQTFGHGAVRRRKKVRYRGVTEIGRRRCLHHLRRPNQNLRKV